MNEQSFEHVRVAADVRAPEPARLVEMRTRSLEQFATSAAKPLAAVAADAPSIGVDRVAQLLDPSATGARDPVR
jgi:hypothetical protein